MKTNYSEENYSQYNEFAATAEDYQRAYYYWLETAELNLILFKGLSHLRMRLVLENVSQKYYVIVY